MVALFLFFKGWAEVFRRGALTSAEEVEADGRMQWSVSPIQLGHHFDSLLPGRFAFTSPKQTWLF